jgi:hypothetical protein
MHTVDRIHATPDILQLVCGNQLFEFKDRLHVYTVEKKLRINTYQNLRSYYRNLPPNRPHGFGILAGDTRFYFVCNLDEIHPFFAARQPLSSRLSYK